MSAVVGLLHRDGRRVEAATAEPALASLAHRGPDGSRSWYSECVWLGHQLLRLSPGQNRGQLPHVDADGFAITADVRLDNRIEVQERLGLLPLHEDAQIVLAAYRAWGTDCVERLQGDFAFAIWDPRQQRLFCARDRFGVKPLYYYSSEKLFAVATEIKALLTISGIPHRVNEARVADFLVAAFTDTCSTFYSDILRLPPGHWLVVDPSTQRLQQYWTLPSTDELDLPTDGAYTSRLRELFTQAVNLRLPSDGPVGSMLSGGMDSSSITCVARDLLDRDGQGDRLHTFSAVFDEVPASDERRYQQAVLATGGVDAYVFHADSDGPTSDLERVLWHVDQPLHAGNLYLNWNMFQAAQDRGVRVILDGFDGDTTLSHGLGLLYELALAKRWLSLAREVVPYARATHESAIQALWAWVRVFGLEPLLASRRSLRLVRQTASAFSRPGSIDTSSTRGTVDGLLAPGLAHRVGLDDRLRVLQSPPAPTEREAHSRRLADAGMPQALEVLDHAAGAFGIELRFPFWDAGLVEFCLAVPARLKMRSGWTRLLMRQAMHGILPPEIQWRRDKADLFPAFQRALTKHGGAAITRVIHGVNATEIERYVNVPALTDTYRRLTTGDIQPEEVSGLWRAASLGLWLSQTTRSS